MPADLLDRADFHAADMLTQDFPTGPDGVLFSHLLDTVSRDQAVHLLRKAFDLLPTGGRIFIYGFMADDDERGGVLAARLSLYLNILATGRGMAWPMSDLKQWLSEIGFTQLQAFPGLPYEHGLLVGLK
jgi:hypothetical protein